MGKEALSGATSPSTKHLDSSTHTDPSGLFFPCAPRVDGKDHEAETPPSRAP